MNEDRTPAPGVNAIDFYRSEIDRLRAENERLRKQVSKTNVEVRSEEIDRLRATMELAERCHLEQAMQWKIENDCLRAKNAEMRAMLISLRQELKGYEMAATGESYNNTELNKLLAKTASDPPASDQERQKSS